MINKKIIDNEKNWNLISKSFDKSRSNPWEICLDFIDSLSDLDILIDIGCGNGRHLIPCTERGKYVIGLDLSRELLNITNNKIIKNDIKNVLLTHSNFQFLPIKDNSLNAVLFIAALHNLHGRNNRLKSLKEINRILKNDGKALISVWSKWQDKYRNYFIKKYLLNKSIREFGDIFIFWRKDGLNIPRFYHLYSKIEFLNDINISGLKLLSIKGVKLRSNKYIDNYFAIVGKK
jgi:alkylated DNA repair protein alkB family protein 8